MNYVIIGNSAAGINCIEALRKVDKESKIINISDEPYEPYSRPLLSYLVAGKVSEERMNLRPPTFYKDMDVTPVLGSPVVFVDAENQYVYLENGQRFPYDKLLIATGRKPLILPIPGVSGEGVFNFTTFDMAKAILSYLPTVRKVGIIGSGLIGLKAAEALRIRGLEVEVVELMDQIMPFASDRRASEILQYALESNGVKFHLGTSAKEILRDMQGRVVGMALSNGEVIDCQMVIVAVGLNPNIDFMKGTDARVNIGLIVDNYMRTTVENVYAAGDVTESKDAITGKSNVHAVWPRASEQGYVAGMNMAGFEKEYLGGYGMNSVSFFGVSCISMGDIKTEKPHYEVLVKETPEEFKYTKIILEDDRIRGAIVVGRFINVSALNRLLRNRVKVTVYKDNLLEEKFVFAV